MATDLALDRRKYPRLKAEALISITRADCAEFAWAVDLSLGGIRFAWVGPEIELGELLHVTFDGGGHPVSTLGKVVRVTDAEAGAQEVALACFEVEAGSLELLQELLEDADEA